MFMVSFFEITKGYKKDKICLDHGVFGKVMAIRVSIDLLDGSSFFDQRSGGLGWKCLLPRISVY
jgi:hypothetical protein